MLNANQIHRTLALGAIAVLGLSLAVLFGCDNSQSPTTKQTDAAMQQLVADYPLDTCIVSDESLDVMGEPVNHMVEGQLVRFCCTDCLAKFEKDPKTYLAKIEAAKKRATQP